LSTWCEALAACLSGSRGAAPQPALATMVLNFLEAPDLPCGGSEGLREASSVEGLNELMPSATSADEAAALWRRRREITAIAALTAESREVPVQLSSGDAELGTVLEEKASPCATRSTDVASPASSSSPGCLSSITGSSPAGVEDHPESRDRAAVTGSGDSARGNVERISSAASTSMRSSPEHRSRSNTCRRIRSTTRSSSTSSTSSASSTCSSSSTICRAARGRAPCTGSRLIDGNNSCSRSGDVQEGTGGPDSSCDVSHLGSDLGIVPAIEDGSALATGSGFFSDSCDLQGVVSIVEAEASVKKSGGCNAKCASSSTIGSRGRHQGGSSRSSSSSSSTSSTSSTSSSTGSCSNKGVIGHPDALHSHIIVDLSPSGAGSGTAGVEEPPCGAALPGTREPDVEAESLVVGVVCAADLGLRPEADNSCEDAHTDVAKRGGLGTPRGSATLPSGGSPQGAAGNAGGSIVWPSALASGGEESGTSSFTGPLQNGRSSSDDMCAERNDIECRPGADPDGEHASIRPLMADSPNPVALSLPATLGRANRWGVRGRAGGNRAAMAPTAPSIPVPAILGFPLHGGNGDGAPAAAQASLVVQGKTRQRPHDSAAKPKQPKPSEGLMSEAVAGLPGKELNGVRSSAQVPCAAPAVPETLQVQERVWTPRYSGCGFRSGAIACTVHMVYTPRGTAGAQLSETYSSTGVASAGVRSGDHCVMERVWTPRAGVVAAAAPTGANATVQGEKGRSASAMERIWTPRARAHLDDGAAPPPRAMLSQEAARTPRSLGQEGHTPQGPAPGEAKAPSSARHRQRLDNCASELGSFWPSPRCRRVWKERARFNRLGA